MRGHVVVRVDRDINEPLVRVGFGAGDSPPLRLHGTAKRGGEGSLVFPEGEPFGRAEVDDGEARGALAGLESFTVMGWLRPTSLSIGSGGNRILLLSEGEPGGGRPGASG